MLGDSARTLACLALGFLGLDGATSLVKGIGFGAVLILSVVAGVLLWQRDLCFASSATGPGGLGIGGWQLPCHGRFSWSCSHGYGALSLWTMHVSDRLIRQQGPGPFAGEPWWEYIPGLLAQALPWTPLALMGARLLTGSGLDVRQASEPMGLVQRLRDDRSWRPPALGLGGCALGFAGAGTCQERALCHFHSSAMVDLGGTGLGQIRGMASASWFCTRAS